MSKSNKRNRINRKTFAIMFIVTILVILLAVLGIRQGLNKQNPIEANPRGLTEEEIEERKDSILVDAVQIAGRATGTEPFTESEDDNIPEVPGPGEDYTDEDSYVRTLDNVTYSLNVSTAPNTNKEDIDESTIIYGGIIKVKATLPNQGQEPNMTWEKDAWMENVQISEDGTELYAEYTIPIDQISCPKIQQLTFSYRVGGKVFEATKDQAPKFEVWMDGNKPDNEESLAESCVLVDEDSDVIKTSAKQAFNIKLAKGNLTQKFTNEQEDGTEENGYYMNFGLAAGIAQDIDTISDLRGLEFPKGDFTVRLKLDYTYSKDGNWTSVDENDDDSKGPANGTRIIGYSLNGESNENYWPKGTSVTNGLPNGKMDLSPDYPERNVQNSGDFIVEQDGDVITITFKDFDITKEFPTSNRSGGSFAGDNRGYFAVGNIQLFSPFYEDSEGQIWEYQLNVSVLDATFTTDTVENGKIEINESTGRIDDVEQSDNILNYPMTRTLDGTVSYSLQVRSGDNTLIESADTNGDGIRGLGDEVIATSNYLATDGPYEGGTERIISWSGDILELVKYDDSAWYKITESSALDVPLASKDNIKVEYGIYLKGRTTGITKDKEINTAKYDEFEWFDTAEEAMEKGKVAAVYINDPDYRGYRNSRSFSFRFKVMEKESSINKVAVIKHNGSIYGDKEREDEKHHIGEAYNKSVYNEEGVIESVHTPRYNGNSILIVQNKVSVTNTVTDLGNDGNPKKNYNVDDGVINYKIVPTLTNDRQKTDADSYIDKVTVTNYLPKGLTYKEASANKQPKSVTVDPKTGQTIIVWEYENWQVNRDAPDFPEITFTANIDVTVKNNAQLENRTVIHTKTDFRDEEQYRTALYGVIIANLSSLQGNISFNKNVVELNEGLTSNITLDNYSPVKLSNVRAVEVLPYNGDENGSDFAGEYNIKAGIIPDNMKVYYTTVPVGLLESKAGLSRDKNDRLNPANINFERNREWIEVESEQEISGATAIVVVLDSISAESNVTFSYDIIPTNNKPNSKYVVSANVIATGFPAVLKTNIDIGVVVQRAIEGTAWYDTNENGLIDTDETKASNINVEVIDTTTNDVAIDVFDNPVTGIKTDEDGNYSITGLKKGTYKVRFELPENTKVTTKGVGTNTKINSKVNTDVVEGKVLTDQLNKLNTDDIENLANEEYINIGIVHETGSVNIKYVDKDTGSEIADMEEVKGPVGQEFDISNKEKNITGYLRTEDEFTKEGIFTKEPQEIIIYYKKVTSDVVVKHILVNPDLTEIVLDVEELNGNVGDPYETHRKDYENYQPNVLKGEPENATGVYTEEPIEVLYYYEKIVSGEVTVRYVKEQTLPDGTKTDIQLDSSIVLQGYVGEEFTTYRKDIPTYSKDESKPEPSGTGTFTKEAQEIKYYYTKPESAGVEVQYLTKLYNEDGTDFEEIELADPTMLYGYIGEQYRTVRLPIDDYRAVEPEPDNAQGVFEENKIVVKYYYEKMPKGELTVKYVDELGDFMLDKDGNEVRPEVSTDYIGTSYICTPKSFEGYSLKVNPENAKGTYTEDPIEVVYVYQRNTYNYTVEYYYETVKDGEYVRDDTLTEKKTAKYKDIIDSYTDNIKGGFEFSKVEGKPLTIGVDEAKNIIKVYYDRNIYNYKVEYYYENDEGTLEQDKLATEYEQAKYGQTITEFRDKIKYGYYLGDKENYPLYIDTDSDNNVIKIKYYKQDAKVVIKYVDIDTDKEIEGVDRETVTAKVGDKYDVINMKKDIENYRYMDDSHNLVGTHVEDKESNNTIYVTFYYKQTGKVTTKFIEVRQEEKEDDNGEVVKDPETGKPVIEEVEVEIADSVTKEDLVGETIVASPIVIKNYTLIDGQTSKEVIVKSGEQVVKFYYTGIAGGIVERHIDVISDEIIEEKVHEGRQGDPYDIKNKTFEGYDLVEDKLPSNSKGEMGEDPIEVNYYYIKKAKVIAKYVDENTGKDIEVDGKVLTETFNGHENDSYKTELKDIEGYTHTRTEGEVSGIMNVEVTLDENNNKVFNNTITITYYYKKIAGGVTERHIDEVTGMLLYENSYTGLEGDPYDTKSMEFTGYDLVEDKLPTNASGKMTVEPILVEYYYKKKAKVEIKYLEKGTDTELAETKVIEGHEGDEYTSEALDIEYYKLVETPENATGKMTAELIKNEDGTLTINDTTTVTYYYEKMKFNFKIDQNITSLKINDKKQKIDNGKLEKVEIHSKEIDDSIAYVTYKVVVTNDSEINGAALVNITLPKGLEVTEAKGFEKKDGILQRTTKELEPGKSETYTIKLKWNLKKAKLGTRTNIAEIKESYNAANFEETTLEDNVSEAQLIISASTGKAISIATTISLITLVIIALGIIRTKKVYSGRRVRRKRNHRR